MMYLIFLACLTADIQKWNIHLKFGPFWAQNDIFSPTISHLDGWNYHFFEKILKSEIKITHFKLFIVLRSISPSINHLDGWNCKIIFFSQKSLLLFRMYIFLSIECEGFQVYFDTQDSSVHTNITANES